MRNVEKGRDEMNVIASYLQKYPLVVLMVHSARSLRGADSTRMMNSGRPRLCLSSRDSSRQSIMIIMQLVPISRRVRAIRQRLKVLREKAFRVNRQRDSSCVLCSSCSRRAMNSGRHRLPLAVRGHWQPLRSALRGLSGGWLRISRRLSCEPCRTRGFPCGASGSAGRS